MGVLNSAAALTLSNDNLLFVPFVSLLFRKPVTGLRPETDADIESTYTLIKYTPFFFSEVKRLLQPLSFTSKMTGQYQRASWVHILFIT